MSGDNFVKGIIVKRVLFSIGVLLASVLAVCCVLSQEYLIFVAVALLFLFILFLLISIKFKFLSIVSLAFAIAFVIIFLFTLFYKNNVEPITNLKDKTATVYGQVIDFPNEYTDYTQYKIKVLNFDELGIEKSFKINCYLTNKNNIEIYDNIKANVEFYEIKKDKKSGNFAKGIYIGTETSDLKFVSKGKSPNFIMSAIVSLRKKVKLLLNENIGKEQLGVIEALTIGDKTNLSYDTRQIFSRCGLSHMLAISGFHLSLIFMSLYKILGIMRIKKSVSCVICILLAIFYAAMTGFSMSVIRALIAFIVVMLGFLLNQQPDTLNSLGLATIIILLINPYSILDIGFLLSVFSLFGIVVLSDELNELCKRDIKNKVLAKLYKGTYQTFNQSFAATIVIMPLLAFFFGNIPILSPIINLIACFPIIVIMDLSLIAIIFCLIPGVSVLGGIIFYVVDFITKFTLAGLKYISSFRFVAVNISFKYIAIALIVVLIFLSIVIYFDKFKISKVIVSFACVSIVIIFAIIGVVISPEKIMVSSNDFFSAIVKNNSCVVIGSGKGYYSFNKLDRFLSDNNINKIDVLILPSDEYNVCGGLSYLLNNYSCDTVITDKSFRCYPLLRGMNVQDINDSEILLGNKNKINFIKNGMEYITTIETESKNLVFCYRSANLKRLYKNDIDLLVVGKNVSPNMILNENQYVFVANYLDINSDLVYTCKVIDNKKDLEINIEDIE